MHQGTYVAIESFYQFIKFVFLSFIYKSFYLPYINLLLYFPIQERKFEVEMMNFPRIFSS